MLCFAGVFKTYFSGVIIFIDFDISNADSTEGDFLLRKKYGRAGPAGLFRFPRFLRILIWVIMMPFIILYWVLLLVLMLFREYYEKLMRRFWKHFKKDYDDERRTIIQGK